jgi:hypothetical protein
MKRLKLEINRNNVSDESAEKLKKQGIMITPPIDKDYWIVRVKLFEDQYIQAFPKFITMGIGFSIEEDWNTNLPYTCETDEIRKHIWHNRKYIAIKKKRANRAIAMIQQFLKEQI